MRQQKSNVYELSQALPFAFGVRQSYHIAQMFAVRNVMDTVVTFITTSSLPCCRLSMLWYDCRTVNYTLLENAMKDTKNIKAGKVYRRQTREYRCAEIIEHMRLLYHDIGRAEWYTGTQLARLLDMRPSTHFNSLLQDLWKNGDLCAGAVANKRSGGKIPNTYYYCLSERQTQTVDLFCHTRELFYDKFVEIHDSRKRLARIDVHKSRAALAINGVTLDYIPA